MFEGLVKGRTGLKATHVTTVYVEERVAVNEIGVVSRKASGISEAANMLRTPTTYEDMSLLISSCLLKSATHYHTHMKTC